MIPVIILQTNTEIWSYRIKEMKRWLWVINRSKKILKRSKKTILSTQCRMGMIEISKGERNALSSQECIKEKGSKGNVKNETVYGRRTGSARNTLCSVSRCSDCLICIFKQGAPKKSS